MGPGCRFRVEHPEGPQLSEPDAAVGEPHADVVTFNDGSGYSADYDVSVMRGLSDHAGHTLGGFR
jgi:hypothetical protein